MQADDSSAPQSNSVVEPGGGLASSPNVPQPGTSINSQTGKPHTAGLTRAQLEAQKAGEVAFQGGQGFAGPGLGSSPNVPKPGTTINPETGKPHTAGLTRAELSAKRAEEGAEQATTESESPSTTIPTSVKPINTEAGEPNTGSLPLGDLEGKKAQAIAAATLYAPVIPVASKPAAEVDPADTTQAGALSAKEVEAFKDKGADLLDSAPQTEQVRRGSVNSVAEENKVRRPSDVNGREQAARQLAGLVPDTIETASAGSSTPGQELPGGWGGKFLFLVSTKYIFPILTSVIPAIKPTPLPGSGPNAPTSLYEDVTEGLGKMGQAAFSVIPSPIKDAFHGPGSPKGRRSSATGLIDQAKAQASKVAEGLQGTIQNTQRQSSGFAFCSDG